MMADAKKQLRLAMKKARGEFASDPARRRTAEKAINETLLSLLETDDNELPDAVFLYRAFGAEASLDRLEKELLEKGILVRRCDNYRGLGESYIRIAVRRHEDNEQLLAAFEEILR